MPRVSRCLLSSWVALWAAGIGFARADPPGGAKPWRARDAVGAPSWLDFGLAHRTRLEHLRNNYRGAGDADATALVMRTLPWVRASFSPVFAGIELEDSRAFATDVTPLDTGSVNAFEVLQAHVGARVEGAFAAGSVLETRLGRITMDVGSRRLVARNRYRNTINAFTGLDAQWTSTNQQVLRAFVVVPVTRLPNDAGAIRDNQIELDAENTRALFFGGFFGSPLLAKGLRLELYAFGLRERDGAVETRNRRLLTPGLRLYRKRAEGKLDFELESATQLGTSRASRAPADIEGLDNRAFFIHCEVGFTLATAWSPRIVAQYDYASGDDDPNDETYGRFDTLFGARRFEWGPTGIYGPFARANLKTPGLRVQLAPHQKLTAFAAHRLYWLASARDAWTTAGLRDPTGSSGSFLGQQLDVRARLHVLPKNLLLELGAAHLIRGGFAVRAPGGRDDPSTLLYAQLAGTI